MPNRLRPHDRSSRADFSVGWLWLIVALLILLAAFVLSDDLEAPAIATAVLVPTIMLLYEIRRRRAVWERWQLQQRHGSRSGERASASMGTAINKRPQPWWEILGIPEQSTVEDVKTAYYAKIKQFHPDIVTGLAKEFQELAERKTKEINQAYRQACQACQGHRPMSPREPQKNETGR
jgi:DnaJ domain